MAKRDQIESKLKSYVDENKLGAFEALYMWSIGIDSKTMAGVLSNKYGSVEGLDTILTDLNPLEIRGPSDRLEVTNEEVGTVIRDLFRKHQQQLLDKVTEKLATLALLHTDLLLAAIRSSLFEQGRIKLDELKLAYRAIFGTAIKDRDLKARLLYLEKVGILYCDRPYSGEIETIIIPEYIYSIQSHIQEKLRDVVITENKEE